MDWVKDFTDKTEEIFITKWDERNGSVIPETETIALKDGAVHIEATFLYADLAGSSVLAKLCPWTTTAKIIRSYLDCCTRSIRAYNGEIRSFDGDRVMGIFKSGTKNNDAAECARKIFWIVEHIIDPKARAHFKSIRENDIKIKHCIGIDTGKSVAVRAGIRNNNDIIWIGRAPSLAAKLSDIRNYPYSVYISKFCHDSLVESNKIIGGINIWVENTFEFAGKNEIVYGTKYTRTP